jgi:hypothetical protein
MGSRGNLHMMMEDGTYLSDLYNEDSTPFLFRNGGQAWLFYSHKDFGGGHIMFAEMNSDGTFLSKNVMGNSINGDTNSQPVVAAFPVVFNYNSTNYISFLRAQWDTTSYISHFITYRLDANFNTVGSPIQNVTNLSYSSLGMIMGDYITNLISATSPISSNIVYFSFSEASGWQSNSVYLAGNIVASASGIYTNNKYYFAFTVTNSANSFHLELGIVSNGTLISSYANSDNPFYTLDFSDAYPFIDPATTKVYFSRYATDDPVPNFDLYRYNDTTVGDLAGFTNQYFSSIIHPSVKR